MSPDEQNKTEPKPPAAQVVKSEAPEKDTTPPASFKKDNFIDFSLNEKNSNLRELQNNQSDRQTTDNSNTHE